MTQLPKSEIKKQHLAEAVQFAVKYVPGVDKVTLTRLLDLVQLDGTHGSITTQQLINKIWLLVKLIPTTCGSSLLILTDLLEIQTMLGPGIPGRSEPGLTGLTPEAIEVEAARRLERAA